MKTQLTSFFSALLLVLFVASCESGNPLIEESKKNIFTQNFEQSLTNLEKALEENPEDGTAYYYKAMTYSEWAAVISDPNQREPKYRNFREAVTTARSLFEEQGMESDEAQGVNDLILSAWGREHNAAITYATNDSVMQATEEPLKMAIAHLENAIIVNPDSTLSYDVLAQVSFMDNDIDGAIDALKSSMALKDPVPADDYNRLSAYYAQSKNYEESVKVLEEATEMYPDTVALVTKLADAYMQIGQRDKSIEIIESLLERDPDNAQYRLALGTQLLQATGSLSDEIGENYEEIYDLQDELKTAQGARKDEIEADIDRLEAENNELQAEIDRLAGDAEVQLVRVIELRPEDEAAFNAMGIIYQNKAAALFDLRNYTTDNEMAAKYDEQAKEALKEAMNYYESAVEINPDKQAYWQSLSSIYVTLGMKEKANEAMQKAGM